MSAKTYRIGEAADLLQLKSYVLRFWETEFTQLAPLRTDKGQRLYTEEHLELLQHIRYLLHEQGMTIDGARRILAAEQRQGPLSATKDSAAAATRAASADPRAAARSNAQAPANAMDGVSEAVPETLRLVRDELLTLRNLLLSQ